MSAHRCASAQRWKFTRHNVAERRLIEPAPVVNESLLGAHHAARQALSRPRSVAAAIDSPAPTTTRTS